MRNNSIFVYPKYSEKKSEPSKDANPTSNYAHLRRPINLDLLKVRSSTIAWARSIPSDIRPRALVIKFPRIANILASAWPRPMQFDKVLRDLMMDDRGQRQGFPLDILQDLANLRAHFDQINKPEVRSEVWNVMDKRGNR